MAAPKHSAAAQQATAASFILFNIGHSPNGMQEITRDSPPRPHVEAPTQVFIPHRANEQHPSTPSGDPRASISSCVRSGVNRQTWSEGLGSRQPGPNITPDRSLQPRHGGLNCRLSLEFRESGWKAHGHQPLMRRPHPPTDTDAESFRTPPSVVAHTLRKEQGVNGPGRD